MSDIRQYLVTVSDDGLTVRRVELSVPSGMRVQLVPMMYRQVMQPHELLDLDLPLLYEGRDRKKAIDICE